ncbi:MAG: carboxypeptidase-like regulatory domain-containing protein [Acidobacteriota bacterium]|nr:carboxypeptidase-like regulatory domain-containing protein [Acidobacteriota bacterium]
MKSFKSIAFAVTVLLLLLTADTGLAQDKSTGGIKGKVRVETGSPSGVSVVVRQGEREVAHTSTDRNGDFVIPRLEPGSYGLTFRKTGLTVGAIEAVEVKAGQVHPLNRLMLKIDEGSIAFLKGSIFDGNGRSLPGARIELARILDDGSLKKIDGRVSNETGTFVFRLTPDPAKYRITAKADGMQPASKDLDVDSAVVYRIAISLLPSK